MSARALDALRQLHRAAGRVPPLLAFPADGPEVGALLNAHAHAGRVLDAEESAERARHLARADIRAALEAAEDTIRATRESGHNPDREAEALALLRLARIKLGAL